ncbi:MAG: LytTR family DNA-binding domain-containing protein [Clostridia bacterium]
MIKIAYCDDNITDRERISHVLTEIDEKNEFELHSFTNGQDLCNAVSQTHFDVILLDILMDGLDGIETATKIRAMGEQSLMIFISSYDTRIKELFDFRTLAFLDKPVDTAKLQDAINKACIILEKDKEHIFSYISKGVNEFVAFSDILYFESNRNKIILHTLNGDVTFYETLTSIWERTHQNGRFVLTHKSYIFNLQYVSLKSDKIVLNHTNESFNIGSKYKIDTEKRYIKFLQERYQ